MPLVPRRSLLASLLALGLVAGACSSGPAGGPQATAHLSAASTPDPAPTTTPEPEPTEPALPPLEAFSKRKAMFHVRKLADDIGVRVRATEGERKGARYIANRFRAMGYDVKMQKYQLDGSTSRNVVATWPDARRYPVVIGGHMDTVPGSPGANDNASGVAVVLELARIFAGRPQSRWVHFVAFGAEEYGADRTHHIGSQVFVRRLGEQGRARLAGMVSVDMIANGRPLIVGNTGFASEIVARTLYNKIDRAGFAVTFRKMCDCSDHGPFERAGIPASFAWSGPESHYHSPSDTTANMKPDDLRRTGRATRAFVKTINKRLVDRFRNGR